MNGKQRVFLVISILVFTVISFSSSNSNPGWIWNETDVNDFNDNQLENLVITNLYGGEVSFPAPLEKTTMDYQDDSIIRY